MRSITLKRRALEHRRVRQLRNLRDLVRLVRNLSRSSLFEPALYEEQRGRRFRTPAAAAWDYVVVGSRSGLVPGPLLLPQVSATHRPPGIGPAAHWASVLRARRFPSSTALPVADLHYYAEAHPEAGSYRGGVLAHYSQVGRHQGFALGPRHTDGSDLVELGRQTVLASTVVTTPTPATATAESVSAVIASAESIATAHSVIDTLLDLGDVIGEIVVVVPGSTTPETRLVAASLTLISSELSLLDSVPDPLVALDAAIAAATGDVVLLVTHTLSTTPADLLALVAAARGADATARVVTPVVLEADDTIRAAGLSTDGDALVPQLNGYPLADAQRAGDREVDAVSGEILAATRAALVLGGQFAEHGAANDTLPEAASSFSARVARAGGTVRVVASATVDLPRTPATGPRRTEPVAAAAPGYADPAIPPVLRWAIKSPHPAGPRRKAWGDYHFARALSSSLSDLGHLVAIDPLDSWYRDTAAEDHVTLTLRGLSRYRPSPAQVNLTWIISHPELVTDDELDEFDAVFAASLSWSRRRTAEGHAVRPLLQCTDGRVFTPDAGEPGSGFPLLFVGNSRSARRPLVEAAASLGRDLAVFGGGWGGRLPSETVRGEYVANDDLPRLYRSAGVVLNDHWPDMAADGFLSNRLFDLTAAGARWVSDPATDLAEVFPQGRVASDRDELARLLDGAPGTFPTEAELQEASERIRHEHTFDVRARTLSGAAVELLELRRGAPANGRLGA